MNNTFTWSPDELYHDGVKGMKWGVRRYQNPDGTLTPEGKVHYGRLSDRKLARQLNRADRDTLKARYQRKNKFQGALDAYRTGNLKRGQKKELEYGKKTQEWLHAKTKLNSLREISKDRNITKKAVDRRVNLGQAIAAGLIGGATMAGSVYLGSKAFHESLATNGHAYVPVGAIPFALFGKNPAVAVGTGLATGAGFYTGTVQKEKGTKYSANKKH